MMMNKTQQGSMAENIALAFLQTKGLRLMARNYKSPGRGGGEVDLIMQEPHPLQAGQIATLVFVEVRQRAHTRYGGAAASVGLVKQRRVIFAARHYLLRLHEVPPCRFDMVSVEGDLNGSPQVTWLPGAFEAPGF